MEKLVILSPHRDDAVFSLGISLLCWRHIAVTVLNFFTYSAYGPRVVSLLGNAEAAAQEISTFRKREDRRALRRISRQIIIRSADLLDAPLRLNVPSAWVSDLAKVSVREQDIDIVVRSIPRLPGDALVLSPLALGDHVDHHIVRAAALRAQFGKRVGFYEDLPYATWTSEEKTIARVRDTESQTGIPLSPVQVSQLGAIRLKRRFAGLYQTQIDDKEAAAISGHARKYRCGERIWVPRHSALWTAITSRSPICNP